MYVFMHQHIIWRDTSLAGIHEFNPNDFCSCRVKVSRFVYHHRAFSTEFERNRGEVFGGGTHYNFTHLRAASKKNVVERHRDQFLRHRSISFEKADFAWRETLAYNLSHHRAAVG